MNKLLPLIIVILFSNCFNRSLSDELLEIPLSSQVSSTISESMSTSKKIYFENGTCKCPDASPGDTEVINQVTYTVVDNSTLVVEIKNENINLCTSLVTDMSNLFLSNGIFNSGINFWDTSGVINMGSMFKEAIAFNQDISNWDISNVVNMSGMFYYSTSFNQDIGGWITTSVMEQCIPKKERSKCRWSARSHVFIWVVTIFASLYFR